MALFAAIAFHSVAAVVMGVHSAFLSLVTGDFTFDPDIQTHPSQGPNMYFL